jgi:hypothetical protein
MSLKRQYPGRGFGMNTILNRDIRWITRNTRMLELTDRGYETDYMTP